MPSAALASIYIGDHVNQITSVYTRYRLQQVAMDIIDPFPESKGGNTYILVATNYFTRWVEAYPIPDQEATTVSRKMVGEFFLPESKGGNTYILVATNYFTRWVEAYPIPDQEATTVSRKMVGEFFLRFSPQERLHSDQGKNVESAVISEVCKLLRIAQSRMDLSNGSIELSSTCCPKQFMSVHWSGNSTFTVCALHITQV